MIKKLINTKLRKKALSKHIRRYTIAALLCLTGWADFVISQSTDGIGKYGASFLQIPFAARQVGMGEAFTGLANDINFLSYNIGGLGLVEKAQLGLNYHSWIQDTQQGAMAFVTSTAFGKFGFNFVYFNEGEITVLDENFNPTGSVISSNDVALTLGVGYPKNIFGLNLSFGGAFKIVRQNLADQSATALGLDLGFLIKHQFISYGATVQNFSITKLKFIEKEDPLPETYRAGIGCHFEVRKNIKVNLAADLAYLVNQKLKSFYGAEVIVNNVIAVRGGYKLHDFDVNRWGTGVGVIIPIESLGHSYTKLDYAFTPLASFAGSTHRFSIVIEFDTMERPADVFGLEEKRQIDMLAEQLRQEVEAAEKARLAAQEAEKRTKELEEEMARRLARIKAIADSSEGKIIVHPESSADSVRFTMRINFDFDQAAIRADEFPTMHQVGEILNTYPGTKVQLAGHTCFIGTEEYNIRLSHRRIDSVMTYLTSKENVELSRFFYPVGYGKQKPIASNDTHEGRAKNRRVDFTIYPLSDNPPIPEGSAIQSVELADKKTIRIVCNGKISKYEVKFLTNPDRIVIDFPGTFLLPEISTFALDSDIFLRARASYHQEENYCRVVLDLKVPIQYQLSAKDNVIYLTVK